jgi:flagellin
MRINRAGDDAAGLAISEKMRGQIRGLKQASRNAQDGISLIQTAEGALNETHAILQRMRELATQSATDTNTEVDRGEIQKEIDQLAAEITRIADTTEFNTQNLLGGEFKAKFHIGANKGQNVDLAINAMDSESLSVGNKATIGEDGDTITVDEVEYKWYAAGADIFEADDDNEAVVAGAAGYYAVDAAQRSAVLRVAASEKFADDDEVVLGIDVNTQAAADKAITTINNALETVSAERSKLGAMQNRLEHTIANLGTSAENLQAAESRIRDLDMADEIMAFTKNNILQQAATAMLAQANMAPQSVLQLLG